MKATTADGYELLHRGSIALAEVESNGIRIDTKYLNSTIESTKNQIRDVEQSIRKSKEYRLWQREYGTKINLDAREQLGHVIYDVLGHPCVETTATGKPKVDQEAFSKIDLPFLRDYERLAKLKKLKSTYLNGVLREVQNGYLHPVFNLHTVETYRGSSDSPNFQNIPIRDPEIGKLIRSAFIARDGHQLVEVDYSGIEVRIAACYNKDPKLITYIVDPTTDMHRDMAAQLYKLKTKEVSKKIRYCAKNMFVFPQFYGDWYQSCCQQLWGAVEHLDLKLEDGTPLRQHLSQIGIQKLGECDPKERPLSGTFEAHVKKVEEDFWNNRFKVYGKWKKDWYNLYLERGWFDLLTGFRCAGVFNRKEVSNYPVQGAAFHCLLASLIELNKWLRKKKMRSKVVGQIHDSIVGDVHKNELDDYLQMAKHIMTVVIPERWKWINVPLDVEAEVSPLGGTWFDKKAVEIAV